jgi:hypothetical protein
MNFNLNLGGLIGALVGGALLAGVIFLAVQPQEFGRLLARLIILGVIGGAAVGNFGWAAVFSKKT